MSEKDVDIKWEKALEERGADSVRALLIGAGEGRGTEIRALGSDPCVQRWYAEAWLVRRAEADERQRQRTERYAFLALVAAAVSVLVSIGAWCWPVK